MSKFAIMEQTRANDGGIKPSSKMKKYFLEAKSWDAPNYGKIWNKKWLCFILLLKVKN